MLTSSGPKVLEYNVRFGDPETQAILVRLQSDLFQVFQAMIAGNLREVSVEWSNQSSACVVLASAGYPGAYKTGLPFQAGPLGTNNNLQVFHAGTTQSASGDLLTSGDAFWA